jgi:thioredoxin 1
MYIPASRRNRDMNPLTLTADPFQADALESGLPVLIDFWAPWCGPCRAVAPVLDEIARDYAGRLTVAKVNVDEEPELARAFSIRSIPTLVVLHEKQVVAATAGALPKAALIETLRLDDIAAPKAA